jgi:CDP-diacylglycerol--glycerol-3-phosphate 3-phosphatidyltransferase
VRELDPSRTRRILAGFQMGFLAVSLWPQIPETVTWTAAFPIGAASLAMFLRDWLYVSHRLR